MCESMDLPTVEYLKQVRHHAKKHMSRLFQRLIESVRNSSGTINIPFCGEPTDIATTHTADSASEIGDSSSSGSNVDNLQNISSSLAPLPPNAAEHEGSQTVPNVPIPVSSTLPPETQASGPGAATRSMEPDDSIYVVRHDTVERVLGKTLQFLYIIPALDLHVKIGHSTYNINPKSANRLRQELRDEIFLENEREGSSMVSGDYCLGMILSRQCKTYIKKRYTPPYTACISPIVFPLYFDWCCNDREAAVQKLVLNLIQYYFYTLIVIVRLLFTV